MIDISSPSNPVERTAFDTPGDCHDIDVAGDGTVYVADGLGGITIMAEKSTDSDDPTDNGGGGGGCFIRTCQR